MTMRLLQWLRDLGVIQEKVEVKPTQADQATMTHDQTTSMSNPVANRKPTVMDPMINLTSPLEYLERAYAGDGTAVWTVEYALEAKRLQFQVYEYTRAGGRQYVIGFGNSDKAKKYMEDLKVDYDVSGDLSHKL